MKIGKTVLHVMNKDTGQTITYLTHDSLMDCSLLYSRNFSPDERASHRLEYFAPEE